jgi:hypothetical protein
MCRNTQSKKIDVLIVAYVKGAVMASDQKHSRNTGKAQDRLIISEKRNQHVATPSSPCGYVSENWPAAVRWLQMVDRAVEASAAPSGYTNSILALFGSSGKLLAQFSLQDC